MTARPHARTMFLVRFPRLPFPWLSRIRTGDWWCTPVESYVLLAEFCQVYIFVQSRHSGHLDPPIDVRIHTFRRTERGTGSVALIAIDRSRRASRSPTRATSNVFDGRSMGPITSRLAPGFTVKLVQFRWWEFFQSCWAKPPAPYSCDVDWPTRAAEGLVPPPERVFDYFPESSKPACPTGKAERANFREPAQTMNKGWNHAN